MFNKLCACFENLVIYTAYIVIVIFAISFFVTFCYVLSIQKPVPTQKSDDDSLLPLIPFLN